MPDYNQTKQDLEAKRAALQSAPTPTEAQELCESNCILVGIAVQEGWDDLRDYGCETDENYCNGECSHCNT
jgi:hypothetical protein